MLSPAPGSHPFGGGGLGTGEDREKKEVPDDRWEKEKAVGVEGGGQHMSSRLKKATPTCDTAFINDTSRWLEKHGSSKMNVGRVSEIDRQRPSTCARSSSN